MFFISPRHSFTGLFRPTPWYSDVMTFFSTPTAADQTIHDPTSEFRVTVIQPESSANRPRPNERSEKGGLLREPFPGRILRIARVGRRDRSDRNKTHRRRLSPGCASVAGAVWRFYVAYGPRRYFSPSVFFPPRPSTDPKPRSVRPPATENNVISHARRVRVHV